MKLKKNENEVIHCKTKEEAEVLIRETDSDIKFERFWNWHESDTCYDVRNSKIYECCAYNWYKANGFEITEFSDLIDPEEQTPVLTAEEAIEWLCEHCIDGSYIEVFGDDYTVYELTDVMTAKEAVERIANWKSKHEPGKKEPEVEWVDMCRIIEVLPDGRKRCVHEEEFKSELPFGGDEKEKVESILKRYISGHDGNYFAVVEHVCRVKKD